MSILLDRPTGVRRSWKKEVPDFAELGERLRTCSWVVRPEWGNPIEGAEFRERKGALRRVQAAYENGKVVDISLRRDGTRIDRVRSWDSI